MAFFRRLERVPGRRIRLLTIVDNHTRESLAIHVSQRICGCEVVQVLERVVKVHGKPPKKDCHCREDFLKAELFFYQPGLHWLTFGEAK